MVAEHFDQTIRCNAISETVKILSIIPASRPRWDPLGPTKASGPILRQGPYRQTLQLLYVNNKLIIELMLNKTENKKFDLNLDLQNFFPTERFI